MRRVKLEDRFLAELREHHKRRQDYMRAELRLNLQAQAICRRLCKGDKAEAKKLWKAVRKNETHEHFMTASLYCFPLIEAMNLLHSHRKPVEKVMEKAAKELPVWPWVEQVPGFGPLGLAQIIGEIAVDKDPEAGRGTGRTTLADFPNPAKLWKFLGLGMVDTGEGFTRQRRVTGAEALIHLYNPVRRSMVYVIGDAIIKYTKGPNPYREVYLERKKLEQEKLPEGRPIVHHRRAHRFMEKRLLRDLWRAWRDMA